MADVQVTCVSKNSNHHEAITHLGGYNWWWKKQDVVDSINKGTNTFYTLVGGRRANIHVVNGRNGPYVQTYADGVWTDNLLALDACKAA